jgi:hypothetical protein
MTDHTYVTQGRSPTRLVVAAIVRTLLLVILTVFSVLFWHRHQYFPEAFINISLAVASVFYLAGIILESRPPKQVSQLQMSSDER